MTTHLNLIAAESIKIAARDIRESSSTTKQLGHK